jgi:Uma2 family endonuclease
MSTSTRVTIAQYDEMIERGVFVPKEDHCVELIEGEIVPMSPIGHRHDDAVEKLTEWSYENRPKHGAKVRVQAALGIPELESVPEPDLVWIRRRSYRQGRPQTLDVLLIVEVSDSSLSYDRGTKAHLYASAGIADYWIVNIPDECIVVLRDPQGGAYQLIQTFHPGESIPLLAFPEIAFPADTVFADEDPA